MWRSTCLQHSNKETQSNSTAVEVKAWVLRCITGSWDKAETFSVVRLALLYLLLAVRSPPVRIIHAVCTGSAVHLCSLITWQVEVMNGASLCCVTQQLTAAKVLLQH